MNCDHLLLNSIPSQADIAAEIIRDAAASGNYFADHAFLLLQSAAGILIVSAAALIINWAGAALITRYSGNSWKQQIITALFLPLITLTALIASVISTLPLIRTLPAETGEMIFKLLCTAGVLIITWGALRIIRQLDRSIRKFAGRQDNSLDSLTAGMIGGILKIIIILSSLMFICQNIFDFNISALLASAGVIGLACALAAKDTISNFFGTLVIVADAPFKPGDRIECNSVCGIVKSVGMRSSRIITDDESLCSVPNSILTNAILIQRNRSGHLKHVTDLALTYDTSPEQMQNAIDILHSLMDDFHAPDLPGFEPRIFFAGFGAYSLNIRAIIFFKTDSFIGEEKLLNELNSAILTRFNAAGLKFAFPTQTLHME